MKITLNSPLDMHLHLRDNEMLEVVAPLSAKNFAGAVVMPNLVPPVKTIEDVKNYKKRILKAISSFSIKGSPKGDGL
jgi:dihydroorotase